MEGQKSSIIIRAQNSTGEEEDVEEIEIEDGQFVTTGDGGGLEYSLGGGVVVDVNNLVDVDVQALFKNIFSQCQTTSSEVGNGTFAVKTNPITGVLELVQIDRVPPSNPELALQHVQIEEIPSTSSANNVEFIAPVTSNTYSSTGGSSKIYRYPQIPMTVSSSSRSQIKRAAPALLRNSRRGLVASPSANTGSASSCSKLKSKPVPSQSSTIVDTPTGTRQQSKQATSSKKARTDSDVTEITEADLNTPEQVSYIIYEDEDGNQQIAPVFENSSTSIQEDHPFLIQIQNASEVVSAESPASLSNATAASQKKKSKKKTASKKVRKSVEPSPKTNLSKKSGSEFKCMESNCSAVTHNVLELRKHLTYEHDMTFDYEITEFPSDAAFKDWRAQYERERMVSFIYRGGTKKISKKQSVTYLVCHRSGHYKPAMEDVSKRKRKMKPQGSCKIGGYCTAGIKLLKSLETGVVCMEICHTHYGHPLDSEAIPHLRVNPVLRKIIQNKFREGMSFADMLGYIHHNPDRLEGLRMVDRRAVRNIYDTWRQSTSDGSSLKKKRNVTNESLMENQLVKEEVASSPEIDIICEDIKLDSIEYKVDVSSSIQKDTVADKAEYIQAGTPLQVSTYHNDESSNEAPVLQLVDQGYETNNVLADCFANEAAPPTLTAVYSLAPSEENSQTSSSSSRCFKLETKEHKTTYSTDLAPRRGRRRASSFGNQVGPALQISPDLDATIDRLHNHGESGPTILLYKTAGEMEIKYGGFGRQFWKDDFCLIIQTPVQRQILQMFPKIINLEIVDRVKATDDQDLKLAFISVVDDFREAIPVAWIVTDSMCHRIFSQLFRTLRYHCGELPVQYIMAPKNVDVLKAWNLHFSHKPQLLQCEIAAKRDLRTLLNRLIPNDEVRATAWTTLEQMLYEITPPKLKTLKDKFINLVEDYPNAPTLIKKFDKDWISRIQEWSFAHRNGATCNLLFISDSFLKLKKFVSFKSTKKLNETVDHILKIGYDKCFIRTKRMFKGDQRFCMVLDSIQKFHDAAKSELKNCSVIFDPNEAKWTVEIGNLPSGKESVFVELLNSQCDCKIICKTCDICMHRYICSCKEFRNCHVMCPHIHKVHLFRFPKPDKKEDKPFTDDEREKASESDDSLSQIEFSYEKNKDSFCEGDILTDQIQGYSLTEVFQSSSGSSQLFSSTDEEVHKIVSVTGSSTEGDDNGRMFPEESNVDIIFHMDADS